MKVYHKENENLSVLMPWMTKQDNTDSRIDWVGCRDKNLTDSFLYVLSSKCFDTINLCF